jgi:probable F420-dependent oxidoreductase
MADPDTIAMAARLTEEAGFHSMWASDHVILVDEHKKSSYPYSPDHTFPTAAAHLDFLDPFVTLSFVAANTTRLRIGTGICLVPERNPLITAKEVSSLDRLSGGRFDFGVGIGWLKEEYEALGIPWGRRVARTKDYLSAMKEIWTSEEPHHEGEFCGFSGIRQYPKPTQQPHPPIIFGGESDVALRRVGELGNGWYGMNISVDAAKHCVARIRDYATAAGRNPDALHFSINPGMGESISEDDIKRLQDYGVHQIIMGSFAASKDGVREEIERIADNVVSVADKMTTPAPI